MVSPDNTNDAITEWSAAFGKGNFGKSLSIGVKLYLDSEACESQQQQEVFLNLVKLSVDALSAKFAPAASEQTSKAETCSFCYKPLGELHYVRGVKVVICEVCVRSAQNLIANASRQ